ncbi:MAG: NUDIX domain-containing protein [Halobacteriales archaeon]
MGERRSTVRSRDMVWTATAEEPPTYCPRCGETLSSDRGATGRQYCPACGHRSDDIPSPMARATDVDGDRVLLVEMAQCTDEGAWALPGAHVDAREHSRDAATRGLAEETGLAVASNELSLVGTGRGIFASGHSFVSINFAALAAVADGELQAADDAADPRFGSLDEVRDRAPEGPR